MNQLTCKDRDLAKDTASKRNFLKTFEDSIIQAAKQWKQRDRRFHF